MTSKREWLNYPSDIAVKTAFGSIYISVTDGDFIYCDANSNGKYLTYHENKYTFNVRLKKENGLWGLQKDEHGRDAIYTSKLGTFGGSETPRTYKKAMLEEVVRCVTKFIEERPELLTQGALSNINNRLSQLEEKEDELEKELAKTKAEKKSLLKKEASVTNKVVDT